MPQVRGTDALLGAEPVRIVRDRPRACLLLHGWAGSPADFADLPKAVDAGGWDVYAPLQAGHGTVPSDLEGVSAEALLDGARAHYAGLRARCRKVALVGFSMGGTLAAILSAEQPPDGLVLLAPFCEVAYRPRYVLPARWWHALLSPFVRCVPRPRWNTCVNRPEGRSQIVGHDVAPTASVGELFRLQRLLLEKADLSRLRMPLLMLYSRGDQVSSPAAMGRLFGRLPDGRKRAIVFELSNHQILHDYDREEAIRAIAEFLGGL